MSKSTMQAVVSRFLRNPCVSTLSIPLPTANEIQVKVHFVALNPTDHKHASFALPPSKVIGCEFSGVITQIGPNSTSSNNLTVGQKVAGAIHGCKSSTNGGFAEYLVADPNLCFPVPDNIPLSQSCSIMVGLVSSLQALRKHLYPDVEDGWKGTGESLLIYSAATNMGMYTLQLARLEFPELYIIAIASARHHETLKKLGADAVFDYNSKTLVDDVRDLGKDISRAVDGHSEGLSTSIAAQCMQPSTPKANEGTEKKRKIVRTLPPVLMKGTIPENVSAGDWIVGYTALGKPFWFTFKYYVAVPEDYEMFTKYVRKLPGWLKDGKMVPIKCRMMEGGLEGINNGFEEMKAGKVRGEKLVYQIALE